MTGKLKPMLLLAALSVAACSRPTLVPLAGASVDQPQAIAQIREGSMFLRGLDQKRLGTEETPNPMSNYLYAVAPGRHALLAMNIQSGHIVPYENMRCFILDADLSAGVTYRLDEDKERHRATLKREDTGAEVASAGMASQSGAFADVCNWK